MIRTHPLGTEREVVSTVTGDVRVGDDVDKKALQVTLAAGTKVLIANVPRASVTLEQPRQVTAENLPVLFDQLLHVAADSENPDPQN